MILKIVVAVVVLLAAILLFAATKPDTFRIQRSLVIQAPPGKISPLINDFHNWPQWAPQDREDATMKRTFGGAERAWERRRTGAASDKPAPGAWRSRRRRPQNPLLSMSTGDGRSPPATSTNSRSIPTDIATKVTCSMHGPNLYMMKLMSVFTNMDRTMGRHFESGLANLKQAAERVVRF